METSFVCLLIHFQDEPDEVGFVKKALLEHLDMDPPVTLGVLCDQIVPPDEPMDEEEQQIRDRLRSLVISFLTGEAKRGILRHANRPGNEAETVLVNELLVVRACQISLFPLINLHVRPFRT
jgi:hypothetical protein